MKLSFKRMIDELEAGGDVILFIQSSTICIMLFQIEGPYEIDSMAMNTD